MRGGAGLIAALRERRSWLTLLVALGIDDAGSGLFLPITLLYVTRVIGLPLATAGVLVSVGTAAGAVVPTLAGPLVDRVGARTVVVAAQLLQAAGAGVYVIAHGPLLALTGAVLLSCGLQAFYSGLFSLISDVAGDGAKDRPFALVMMIRSASFGLGGLIAAPLLAGGPSGYRLAMIIDGVSFVVCAALLLALVGRPQRHDHARPPADVVGPRVVLRDRPFLGLVVVNALLALGSDLFLLGMPVYVTVRLHAAAWLPGVLVAELTLLTSTGGVLAVRATRRRRRTSGMALGAVVRIGWCAACLGAVFVPNAALIGYLVGATALGAVGFVIGGPGALALAEASAPAAARGRYMATFQYSFLAAQIIAPALVALSSAGNWLPWVLCAANGAALPLLRLLANRLPAEANDPSRQPARG